VQTGRWYNSCNLLRTQLPVAQTGTRRVAHRTRFFTPAEDLMTPVPTLIPASLRRLFLAIARASVAGSLAGCLVEHIAPDEDAGEPLPDASAADAAQHHAPPDAGSVPDARVDAGTFVPPDAAADLDAWLAWRDAGGLIPDPGDDGIGWQRVPCVADGYRVEPTDPQPTRPVDSIQIFEEGQGVQIAGRYTAELARVGGRCSGAGDVAAFTLCEERVALLASATNCPGAECRFVIAGRGGEYERLNQRDELLALLGSIDAVADAVLLAAFDGHMLCPGVEVDPRDVGTDIRSTPAGYELRITREECSGELYTDRLTVAPDGTLSLVHHAVHAQSLCAVGRRPAGLRSGAASGGCTRVGAFLAQAAHLEAASVHAFHQLLRELRAMGAPESLRRAALDALLDEVRHAQTVGELARAHGGEVERPDVAGTALRSAYELALENIGEGCVRETFGALQATYQAETAENPRVRRVMAQIAEDETRHAQLAWALQAWLEPQLSQAQRAQVTAERNRVLEALAADLDVGLSREEHAALGFPTADVSAALLRSMSQALYA
jgi:hypothetical protein